MSARIVIVSVFILAAWFMFTGKSASGEVSASKSRAKSDVVRHPIGCIVVHQEGSGLVRFEVYLVGPSTQRLIEPRRVSRRPV